MMKIEIVEIDLNKLDRMICSEILQVWTKIYRLFLKLNHRNSYESLISKTLDFLYMLVRALVCPILHTYNTLIINCNFHRVLF